MFRVLYIWLAVACVPALAAAQTGRCEPLPAPVGNVVNVSGGDSAALADAVGHARSGATILLRDGTYRLRAPLMVRTAGVTIRSASADAGAVVLDAGYDVSEPLYIEAAGVTVADLTITRAADHLVHIVPAAQDLRGIRLHGLRLIDSGEQFVKANPNPARTAFVDDVVVECSDFTMTDAGRARVEASDATQCYTGGIDVHAGRGWTVRWNRFEGIYCRNGFVAEHAIHFWRNARDTIVENNTILNCARGIGFGLGAGGPPTRQWDDAPGGYAGHIGGVIRNNIIYANVAEFDTGIGLEQARDVRVVHNTIFAAAGTKAFSSVDARFGNTRAVIQNNLVNNITARERPQVTASHNIEGATAGDFVDVSRRDFHLRPGSRAIGAGTSVPDAGVDMDGRARSEKPSAGAYR